MKTNIKKSILKNTKFLNKQIAPFNIGDTFIVKISALGFKNLGLAELPNGYTIVIPNVNLEDEVRVQIETIVSQKTKYATAKVVDFIKKAKKTLDVSSLPRVGEILEVTIAKAGPKDSGLVQLFENFTLIVPKTQVGDQLKVKITRIKANYAFAKTLNDVEGGSKHKGPNGFDRRKATIGAQKLNTRNMSTEKNTMKNDESHQNYYSVGSKIDLILPKSAKSHANYVIVRLNQNNDSFSKKFYVFIKMGLGAQLGDSVRIKIMKTGSNFAVAKILKVSPMSKYQKHLLAKNSVKKMIRTGMHFGEKTIRCHANMRKFVWQRKKGKNQNRPLIKRGRHLINLLKTRRCLTKALKQLAKYAAKGRTFLFVGTKKSAAGLIARTAMLTKTSFFVNTRWLGGMLTNWKTILKSIAQIRPILKEKQRIIKKILEKRQKIKTRLIKKVNLLRKRSQKLMTKGKFLIARIKNNKHGFIENSQKLVNKKTQLIKKNEILIQKYTQLNLKHKKFVQQNQQYRNMGNLLIQQKNNLLQQLQKDQAKLKQFTQLFLIGQQLIVLKKSSNEQGKQILALSYAKFTKLLKQTEDSSNPVSYAVPNPPKQVLNTIINSMKIKYDINNEQFSTSSLNSAKTQQFSWAGNNVVFSAVAPELAQNANTIVVSKLLNKFTRFLPFIRVYIETLILRIQNNQALLTNIHPNIQVIKTKINEYDIFIQKIVSQLQLIKTKLLAEQKNLLKLKIKLKKLASEQRLLKFLPKLRYLPTPKTKMSETIQVLMKKFVDPKMSYPMDQIYDDKLKFTSKKIAAARKQKWQRLEKYFGGLTKMAKMNKKQISNNVAIIIGQQEEMNAVRECQKLGIKMFTVVDTNCNPRLADHVIPANDDSRNSIKFVLGEMLTRIRLAQKLRKKILSRRIRKYSNKK
uniref:Small ribosomal subunit protein uS2c n=1 Tax=Bracteacoccus giganteus TaxID=50039 RepID=A0A0S2LQ45_9CHLO|nr:ribosomal protein S2 [Bracteacoccus giganteus]ALO63543.1 ribosomal protein S2 [Bracteacoccus giganteus]